MVNSLAKGIQGFSIELDHIHIHISISTVSKSREQGFYYKMLTLKCLKNRQVRLGDTKEIFN